MEYVPCEALDLDDSDLHSRFRPCNRRRPSSTSATNPLPPSSSIHPPELPSVCAARRRTIPGPAGAVQAAIHRRYIDRENQNISICNIEGTIPTQDYVRGAMEDTSEFDDDFNGHPWISALQFLGARDGVFKSKPISSLQKCVNGEKVDKVVAVIKSCTPSALGGLIVLLKDPTGSIGASIHHKVLSESDFGKSITVGSVLILQKVTVFAPARSTLYLNVTLGNLVQVFCQDGVSISKLNDSSYLTQYADPGRENCGKSTIQHAQNSTRPRSSDEHRKGINKNHLEFVKRGHSEDNEVVTTSVGRETQGNDTVHMQSQTLPQWTDEQLDELFAGDETWLSNW